MSSTTKLWDRVSKTARKQVERWHDTYPTRAARIYESTASNLLYVQETLGNHPATEWRDRDERIEAGMQILSSRVGKKENYKISIICGF